MRLEIFGGLTVFGFRVQRFWSFVGYPGCPTSEKNDTCHTDIGAQRSTLQFAS